MSRINEFGLATLSIDRGIKKSRRAVKTSHLNFRSVSDLIAVTGGFAQIVAVESAVIGWILFVV